MGNRRLISHSEVDTLNQCERKHYYAQELQLEALTHSDNLNTGITGHAFFEEFFNRIKAGDDTDTALKNAMSLVVNEPSGTEALALTVKWVKEVWPTLPWRIVAVEQELRVAVSETLVFPFKFDLLVETRGELVVVDHKFLGDPYPQAVIDLLPQLPKYIFGLRKHGYDVKYGIYNMLRTRKTSIDVLTQVETHPSETRINNSFREQLEGMRRIEAGIPNPMRTASKMNCMNCQFKQLCTMDLNGEPTEDYKRIMFKPNTYGYKDE